MSRYLEIDSTYRNRNMWSKPAEFELLIAQSGLKGKLDALDPVSLSMPIKTWVSNNFVRNTLNTASVDVTVSSFTVSDPSSTIENRVGSTNTKCTFYVTAELNSLQYEDNYYAGAVMIKYDNLGNVVEKKRILEYIYRGKTLNDGNDRGEFTVESVFSTLSTGDILTITDPTDFSDTSFPLIFIPNGSVGVDVYTNYLLYNESLNDYRVITSYDPVTKLLQIDTTVPLSSNWKTTDFFDIRKQIPIFSRTTRVGTTASRIDISGCDENSVGMFIRVTYSNSNPKYTSLYNSVSRIISYDPTGSGSVLVNPSFNNAPINYRVELLPFSYDNSNPFIYTGSMISQQEEVCYEVKLLNLILPNKTLVTGSRIAYYPYVYVELSNISTPGSGLKNTIYSNNPNCTNMLFRAPVTDVARPQVTTFINLYGDDMPQVVKMKINDSFKFSVRLQNGAIYETVMSDTSSPSIPNPEVQISAVFSFKRI